MNRYRNAALIGGVVVAMAVAAVLIITDSPEIAGKPTAQSGEPVEAAATPVPTTEEPAPLDLDDFAATLKITDKQCFGSAGCNVTVEPNLQYVHDIATLESRSYSITLTISGDESGPVITTIDGTGDSYDVVPVMLSTHGSGVKPKATVTDVQEY